MVQGDAVRAVVSAATNRVGLDLTLQQEALFVDVSYLPTVNAFLNGMAACLLAAGFVAIRRKNITLHRNLMISALVVSVLFLASYVTYHTVRQMTEGVGHTRFTSTGPERYVYYVLLVSHVILAIVNLPMVIVTVYYAIRRRFDKHKKIARWTWPIWMYVSVTGVAVYLMLYVLYPPQAAAG